ncbi:MAG: hypothetical protein QOG04_1742 [Actinomycetota bacterium]|jgi:uncharacterized protein YecE (DUF72 family)|nr:hypothetical protein [Actinomycetota bacterium]
MGEILIGTASWTDKSLLGSGWYPKGVDSAEERLKFYATHFPLVEVDSTYYFPPSEKNSELWVERTPEDFTFNIKAFSLLTQHPTKAEALYKDMPRPDKRNIYPKDLEPKVIDEVWDRFLSALEPLDAAGKLGVLLFQFPPWFTISKANKAYVLECAKRASPMNICVEFRNKTWMEERNVQETLDFLEGHGLPYVCVDMPQGFKSSIPPVIAATADLAVIRFHGHNADEWESGSVQRRFAYLYSEKELKSWAPKIEKLASEAKETHVLMNNCHSSYAQQNAKELADLLKV